MIDYEAQAKDRLIIPAVPDDIKFLGDRIDSLAHWMHKLYDAQRRQESPNPSTIRLNPGVTYQSTAAMRPICIVFSGGTAGSNLGIKFSSAVAFDWLVPSSPGIITMPFTQPFDAGNDISVVDLTTPGSVNWRCWALAYVELEESRDA